MSFTKILSLSFSASLIGCVLLTSCDVDWRGRRDITEEKEKEDEHEEALAALERTRKTLEDERNQKKIEEQNRDFKEKSKALDEKAKKIAEMQKNDLAKTLEEQKKLEEEKLAEEARLAEEEARLAALELEKEKREEQRRISACERFKGRSFEKLTLDNGETLENLTVTSADAIGVTFMYEHGIKRIPFTNLPEDIRKECMYDPDAAKRRKLLEQKIAQAQYRDQQAIERIEREKKIRLKQITTFGKSDDRTASSSTTAGAASPSYSNNTKVSPRGNVTVTLGGINYRDSRYMRGQKLLKIKAISNVPAYLYLDGSTIATLSPNVPIEVDRVTSTTGEYTVTLRSSDGVTLDEERHNRKTGLTTGGL